jgi:carbamoyl-phosphate synthase large subunit
MKHQTSLTLFLTAAGGAAMPGLIRRLKKQGCKVIAGDMDPLATGFLEADQSYVLPAAVAPEFVGAVRAILDQEKVDCFIPLVDEELRFISRFREKGHTVLAPTQQFVDLCLDKPMLMDALLANSIPAPRTLNERQKNFPVVVKPKTGRGSRGVFFAHSQEQLAGIIASSSYSLDDILIQEYINGTEFTVSVVVDEDNRVHAVVPKEIIRKRGITQYAVTRKNERIHDVCNKICKFLLPHGPCNVQLCLDNKGIPFVFEINPRFSTTISLTMAAGIDELFGLAMLLVHGKRAFAFGAWKEGVVLARQTLDTFLSEKDFTMRAPRAILLPQPTNQNCRTRF